MHMPQPSSQTIEDAERHARELQELLAMEEENEKKKAEIAREKVDSCGSLAASKCMRERLLVPVSIADCKTSCV
jgi:hypothetical protein